MHNNHQLYRMRGDGAQQYKRHPIFADTTGKPENELA